MPIETPATPVLAAHAASFRTFVDGRFVDGDGPALDVEDPYRESAVATVGESSVAQVDAAVAAARRSQDDGSWSGLRPAERRRAVQRLVDALRARRDDILTVQIAETGMYRMMCGFAGTDNPLRAWDHYAELAGVDRTEALAGMNWPTAFGRKWTSGAVFMEPAGVVSAIVPFNFPFMVATHKVAAALAAGCSVVLKASELTPLTCALIAEAAAEAELPPGALNYVIGGAEVGARMVEHPDVDVVSFTGSVDVGTRIGAVAAAGVKRTVLELGGKSAAVVCDDADLDTSVTDLLSAYSHAGQGCALTTRLVVHEAVADEVVARMTAMAQFLKPGDPAEPTTTHNPQITAAARDRVLGMIERGVESGAELVYGGGPLDGQPHGHWVAPTLFDRCPVDAEVAQTEIFGPVLVVHRVADDDEAVAVANDSQLGLWGTVHTRDLGRGVRIARRIRSGCIGVNGEVLHPDAPFGGVKLSGIGREFGEHGVREFLEPKSVTWHD